MKISHWVIALAIILGVVNVLDVLTTKVALSVGCVEGNGFAIALFTTFGSTVGMLVKFGAAFMVGCSTVYSCHLDCRALRIVLTTCLVYAVCLYVAVVGNNIVNILR